MAKIDDDELKLTLIRDSLIGASYHLANPEVFLYPFLDNLLLLHQRPLVFTLWQGEKYIYSSLNDPHLISIHNIVWNEKPPSAIKIPWTNYLISVHDLGDLSKIKNGVIEVDTAANDLTKRLLSYMNKDENFFKLLDDAIKAKAIKSPNSLPHRHEVEPFKMEYGEVTELLEPMRRVLDHVFADAIRHDFPGTDESQRNAYTVFRTVTQKGLRYDDKFSYTAGLILSNKTHSEVHAKCDKCLRNNSGSKTCDLSFTDTNDYIAALERPLGLSSRSVSDLVFSSGLSDFGRRAGESIVDVSEPDDAKRKAVERCMYPSDGGLYYSAIHVGGTPWMAIFTFACKDDDWHHNYVFYRDLMQKSAALIRQKAHDCYAELVAKTLVKHMESWAIPIETWIDHVNTDMQKLAQVYPFPMLKLHMEPLVGGKKISVSDRGIFEVSFKQNPFFPRQVDWNIGNENEILYRCQEALKKFEEIKHSAETKTATQLLKVIGVESLTDGNDFDNIIGSSTVMISVYALIRRASSINDLTVLITGEHGTGKELVAKAIHSKSKRSNDAFITLNCVTIPKDLLESELFGHVKGAFSGATESKKGKFELADNGTIFLDEIGDMLPELQAKLLRVIQEKEFYRLGDTKAMKVDIRIIAATNQNLQKAIKESRFREDLYYRLEAFPIQLPPLRDRKGDIIFLTKHFLEKSNNDYGKNVGISEGALNRLMEHSWPGNVRELENKIRRLVIMCDSEEINVEHLSEEILQLADNLHINESRDNSTTGHPDGYVKKLFPSGKLRNSARLYLDKYETACAEIPPGIKVTHEIIADKLGITRPNVTNVFKSYGEIMLAFLDAFPDAWPNFKKINIRKWCQKKT